MKSRVLRAARLLMITLGLVVLGRLGQEAWRDYSLWRSTINDPSARDAYLTFFEVELVLMIAVLLLLALGLWLLRVAERNRSRRLDT